MEAKVNPYLDKEKELAKQESFIDKQKWECMCPGCCERAINSHLLQRNGILNHIAKNGHLYEIRREDFFKWHTNGPVKIKKIGIQQALSFPLFCSKHDTEIYKPIEESVVDFDDYKSQLLFSYRAACSELFKKRSNQIRYEFLPEGCAKNESIEGTEKGIKDLLYYKYLFEDELKKSQGKFSFLHVSYPFIGVCASAAVSYEPIDFDKERSVMIAVKKKVWDGFFINVIPQKESLEVIIGYHNNHVNSDMLRYIESWKGLSFNKLQNKLTDLFCAKIESWSMSPDVFEHMSEGKKKWMMDVWKTISGDFQYDIRTELEGNLFE